MIYVSNGLDKGDRNEIHPLSPEGRILRIIRRMTDLIPVRGLPLRDRFRRPRAGPQRAMRHRKVLAAQGVVATAMPME